jgi:hypothetical protein
VKQLDIRAEVAQEVERWQKLGGRAPLAQFVLRNGKVHAPAPLPAGFKRMTKRECFKNATDLATDRRGLTYVEGLAVSCVMPILIHHAWCIDEAGNVVDPTWDEPENCLYMGVEFDLQTLVEKTLERQLCGLLTDEWQFNFELMFTVDPGLEALVFQQ